MGNTLPILLNGLRFCGCDSEKTLDCCSVTELGEIYSKEPDFSSSTPCVKCIKYSDISLGEIARESSFPHGTVGPWKRACARMTVLVGAYVKNGELVYRDRLTYYSRQRNDLPNLCRKPILCPPQNGLSQCCGTAGQKGGPYTGVSNPCSTQDSTEAPKVRHGYSFSPCQLNNGRYIAGYALAPNNWWFYGESSYDQIIQRIKQEDPFVTPPNAKEGEEFLHTIYIHFQLTTRLISCCDFGNGESANRSAGKCGQHRTKATKVDREKSVKITASIGYAMSPYGLNPEQCCESSKTIV